MRLSFTILPGLYWFWLLPVRHISEFRAAHSCFSGPEQKTIFLTSHDLNKSQILQFFTLIALIDVHLNDKSNRTYESYINNAPVWPPYQGAFLNGLPKIVPSNRGTDWLPHLTLYRSDGYRHSFHSPTHRWITLTSELEPRPYWLERSACSLVRYGMHAVQVLHGLCISHEHVLLFNASSHCVYQIK